MKKILIIVRKRSDSKNVSTQLINEYVESKKSQGYQLELIGDEVGVLKELLDEQELWGKKITSAQSNVMFDLATYERILYVPEHAETQQDVLVYDSSKLDKNMIFYNIGNMLIVDTLEQDDAPQDEQKADAVNHEAMPQQVESDLSGEVGAQNVENRHEEENNVESNAEVVGVNSGEEENLIDEAMAEENHLLSETTQEMQETEGEQEIEVDPEQAPQEEIQPAQEEIQSTQDSEQQEQSLSQNEKVDDFASNYSVIGEMPTDDFGAGEESNPQENVETEDSLAELSEQPGLADMQEPDLNSVEESADRAYESENAEGQAKSTLSAIDEISSDSIITISENEIRTDMPYQPPQTPQESEVMPSVQEGQVSTKGLSVPRRLWIIAPWIIMPLMALLKYEKITWIPFILSVLALISASIPKKTRHLSKTPEFLCVFVALVALMVSFVYPQWMLSIAIPISAMAIVLFLLVGTVHWDN